MSAFKNIDGELQVPSTDNPMPVTGNVSLQSSQIGTQGTGSSYDPPTGGSGVFGWLSGIFKEIVSGIKLKFGGADVSAANPLPVISGKAVSVTATSLASQVATSYAAGTCIGGLYEFPAFFTDGVDSGVIQKLLASFDSANLTAIIDAYVFKANPSASTITDGAAFVLAAADIDKLSTVIQLAPRGSLGASGVSTVYEASDIWRPASGTTTGKLYVVLVAESALTLTAGDLIGLKLGGSRD